MSDRQLSQLDFESQTPPQVELIPASRAVMIGICIIVFGVALAARGLLEIRRAPSTWPAFIESMAAWSGIIPLATGSSVTLFGIYFAVCAIHTRVVIGASRCYAFAPDHRRNRRSLPK